MTLRGNTPTIAVVVMHVIATRFQEWRSTKSRITVRIMTSQTPVHRHVRCVPDYGCPENGGPCNCNWYATERDENTACGYDIGQRP